MSTYLTDRPVCRTRTSTTSLRFLGAIVATLLLGCGDGTTKDENAASDDSGASESGEMVPDLPAEPEPCEGGYRCVPHSATGECDAGLGVGWDGICEYPCDETVWGPQLGGCEAGTGCLRPPLAGAKGYCAVRCEAGAECPEAWTSCQQPWFDDEGTYAWTCAYPP